MIAARPIRLAALLLIVAAAGHAVEVPHHGLAFALVAAAQLLAAGTLLSRPSSPRRAAVVLGLVALVCFWAVSRTAGLPFGPHAGEVQPLGPIDGATVGAQVAAVAFMLPSRRPLAGFGLAASAVVLAVGLVAWGGSAGSGDPASRHRSHGHGAHGEPGHGSP